MQHNCTLETEDGQSQYFNFTLSTWMDCASVVQFSVYGLLMSIFLSILWLNNLIWEMDEYRTLGRTIPSICGYNIWDITGCLGCIFRIIVGLAVCFFFVWAFI